MKIDFLQSENRLRSKSQTPGMCGERNVHREITALCDERRSMNNNINGSNMRNENVAAINFSGKEPSRFAQRIYKSKPFNSALRFFENKTDDKRKKQ